MALQKQVISIPMGAGIDTKTAPALLGNDKYQLIQNAVFVKGSDGALHKRNGYSQLPKKDANGNSILNASNLSVYNDELCMIANGTFYTDSPAFGWIPVGPIMQCGITELPIVKSSTSAINPDMAYLSGITIYAWEQGGSAYVQQQDATNGQATFFPSILTNGTKPKVVNAGTQTLVLTVDPAGNLWSAVAWDAVTTGPGVYPPTQSNILPAGMAASSTFDAAYANGVLVVVGTSAANVLTAWSFSVPALGLTATQAIPSGILAQNGPIACCADGTQVFVAGTTPVFNQIPYAFLTVPGLAVGTNGVISALGTVTRMTSAAVNQPTTGLIKLFVETSGPYLGTADPLPTIQVSQITNVTGLSDTTTFMIGASISSQPFVMNSNCCLLCSYAPTLPPDPTLGQLPSSQQTLFLIGQDGSVNGDSHQQGVIYGKFFVQTSGGPPTNQRQPLPQTLSTGVIEAPASTEVSFVSNAGLPAVITGISTVTMDFASSISATQLGQNLHIASGSLIYDFDGFDIVEHNFDVFPEAPILTYLTSQIQAIVNSFNSIGQAAGSGGGDSIDIYIPDNPINPGGPAGGLITPGEYISIGAGHAVTAAGGPPTYGAYAFYFTVDGVGSAPTGANFAGFNMVPVAISSQHTATNIATILQKALNAVIGTPVTGPGIAYTPTYTATPQVANVFTAQKVNLKAFRPDLELWAFVPPSMNRTFNVWQGFVGGPTRNDVVFISCCPANLIQGGQYFQFQVYDKFSAVANIYGNAYVWFQMPGYTNGDPKPVGPAVGEVSATSIKVTLGGTEDAGQVAAAVSAAIQTAIPNGITFGVACTVTGSNITVTTQHVNNTYPNPQFDFNANNPRTNTGTVNPDWVAGVAGNSVGANPTSSSGVGVVQYSAIYEWQDGQGQIHKSTPSNPALAYIPFYATTGGVGVPPNAAIKASILPLTLTRKNKTVHGAVPPTVSEADIAIYRTITNNNSVSYRVTSPLNLLANTPNSPAYITYNDSSSETGILSNEPLYTVSSLPYNAPPAASIIVAHGDRLWLSGLEDPNLLWYSLPWQGGLAVAFSNEQTIRINPSVGTIVGGPITAISPMDGNLIVFEKSQIWAIAGSGPNALGLGTQFGEPQLISATVGCRDVGSVQLGPSGLYFKSLQGFYLLNRQSQIGYIGDEVEAYNADVVVSSQRATDSTQIRFLSTTGTTLLYDFFYDQWGPLSNHQGTSDVLTSEGVYTYIDTTNRILQENPGSTNDAGTGYSMVVQTAWIKFTGVQGFQRLWKFVLKGLFVGTQPLQIQIAYDYNPTPVDTFVYNQDPGSTGLWGGDPLWGSSTPWGGVGAPSAPDVMQLRIFNSRQLCEAIQITIQDLAPFPASESWSLDAIDFEVGVRKGAFRNLGGSVSVP